MLVGVLAWDRVERPDLFGVNASESDLTNAVPAVRIIRRATASGTLGPPPYSSPTFESIPEWVDRNVRAQKRANRVAFALEHWCYMQYWTLVTALKRIRGEHRLGSSYDDVTPYFFSVGAEQDTGTGKVGR